MTAIDLGIIGLGVMGRSLALNAAEKGFSVAVYNRTEARTRDFAKTLPVGASIAPAYSIDELVGGLSKPKRILLMVKSGAPTDAFIEQLLETIGPGSVLMDGGNAHFTDTERRQTLTEDRGVHFMGIGVSGGEWGARHGPSIMPGGSAEAYANVAGILESIAAQGPEGPCCAYLGPGSAGHYVKMVHNGIEYALMQVLAEAYDIMRRGLGLPITQIADVFGEWNGGLLESYLLEIVPPILQYTDPLTGDPLVERIVDEASQKGTGAWTVQAALDIGSPSPLIAASVFARLVSSLKSERKEAAKLLAGPEPAAGQDQEQVLADLHAAVVISTVVAYAQGFRQLKDASTEMEYGLSLEDVARIWMAGCIIRSALLTPIREAFVERPDLKLLLAADPFRAIWNEHHAGFRRLLAYVRQTGIPVPGMSSALDFADAYRADRLPANLIQAQRDFFGAHTYRRVDVEGDHHTDWEAESPS